MIMNIFLNRLPPPIKSEIFSLFNISWCTGTVPGAWKQGITCPILKPGKDPTSVTSYRPITLLPCLGKMMERIVLHRLEHYLESNHLLPPLQYGFRRGRSTLNALHLVKNEIVKSMKRREYCVVVYLDLQGAFDRVWHQGLLFKLAQLGVSEQTLVWLYNYLDGRSTQVRVGTSLSEATPIHVGVPQGAVLSPTLFNVMLSDVPSSPVVRLVGYADDLTLLTSSDNPLTAQQNMQAYLVEFTAWCTRWHFLINPDKCTYQIFTSRRILPHISLRICNRIIALSSEQRVL